MRSELPRIPVSPEAIEMVFEEGMLQHSVVWPVTAMGECPLSVDIKPSEELGVFDVVCVKAGTTLFQRRPPWITPGQTALLCPTRTISVQGRKGVAYAAPAAQVTCDDVHALCSRIQSLETPIPAVRARWRWIYRVAAVVDLRYRICSPGSINGHVRHTSPASS